MMGDKCLPLLRRGPVGTAEGHFSQSSHGLEDSQMSIFNYRGEMTNKLLEVSKFQAWPALDPPGDV